MTIYNNIFVKTRLTKKVKINKNEKSNKRLWNRLNNLNPNIKKKEIRLN